MILLLNLHSFVALDLLYFVLYFVGRVQLCLRVTSASVTSIQRLCLSRLCDNFLVDATHLNDYVHEPYIVNVLRIELRCKTGRCDSLTLR